MTHPARNDVPRITLPVIFIGALIVAAFWVLRPFLAPAIWSAMIVVSTWPMLRWVEARFGGRRALAAAAMTLLLPLLFVVPLMAAIGTIVGHADDIARWFVAQAGNLGFVFVQFLLTALLAAVMYAGGETAVAGLRRFANRLAGEQGDQALTLAGQAIRGAALGVGVTAVVQAVLGGIGLAMAGVPFVSLLTAVMLLLGIAQIGCGPVLLAATGWLFWRGETGWGSFALVWSVAVMTLDNVLRPLLIKRGADLPLLLIFAGVIGGLLAFGLMGLFVGPVVLAVAYTLLDDGMRTDPSPEATAPGEVSAPAVPQRRAST